jgi:hypothetical protein
MHGSTQPHPALQALVVLVGEWSCVCDRVSILRAAVADAMRNSELPDKFAVDLETGGAPAPLPSGTA